MTPIKDMTRGQLEEVVSNPQALPQRAQQAAHRLKEIESDELNDVYSQCFGTDAGRQVLKRLKALYPPTGSRFNDERGKFDPCPVAAARRDGAALVVSKILERLERAPNCKVSPD